MGAARRERGEVTRTGDRWKRGEAEARVGCARACPVSRDALETRWLWGAETRRVPQPPRVRPCTPLSRLDERMRRGRGASRRAEKRWERSERARVRAGVLATGRSCGNTEARRARVCARLGVRGLRQTRGSERFFVVRTNPPNFHPTGVASETSAVVATVFGTFAAKCAAVRGRARRGKRHISPRGVAATPRCPSRWTSSWCRARRS